MRRCRSAPTGICLVFLAVLSVGIAAADESTWSAPPGRVQLAEDPQLIPKGKGMLFVPMMSVPHGNEPSYQIYRKGGEHVGSASPGSGVLLPPGSYRVRIGSGAISQMIRKTVEVMEGSSTLLKPDWSALVIDVIDQARTPVSESYELYQEETQENFGQGLGIEEERGEKVRTWILKPGVYHVVKVGESFSTIRKFSVRLEPGKLVQRDLVYDGSSGDFIGFYARPVLPYGTARIARNVTSQTELSGSTLFHTSQNTAGEDMSSTSLSLQVFNRTRYSTDQHFANLRLIFEEGATQEGDNGFHKSIDKLELRGTYIYRVSTAFGPYLRGVLNTKLFSDDVSFDRPFEGDFVKYGATGDTLNIIPNPAEVTLSPAFFPLRLRQGIGINSQLVRSFALNADVRLGFGARQTYVSNSFELGSNQRSATELRNAFSTGFEAVFITDARLAKSINFDSEFDILIPGRNRDDWVFSWQNRLRIFLTSFINLDLVADLEREETLKRLQGREQILLRFSRFF